MARKATGSALEWRSQMKVWVGRVRGYPEGCARGRWLSLGTDDKAVAQQRYDHWLLTGEPPKESREETFAEASERIVDAMPVASDAERKKSHDRRTRLRTYAFPILGHIAAWAVEGKHVASVLDRMPALGKKKGTIAYVRTDISQVLTKLVREGARGDNPARHMAPPSTAVEDGRLRQVPTDGEFLRFRAARGFKTELDIACLLCRDLAAHRTSDLLAARWEHVTDWEHGKMKVRRPKTDTEGKLVTTRRIKSYELVEHGVPPSVWAVLKEYWVRQGRPLTGPLFPVRKECKGGVVKRKDGSTYTRKKSLVGDAKSRSGAGFVKPLRVAFWKAKLYRPMPVGTLIDGVPTTHAFDPDKPDKGLCFFQTDTDESRALDFHSVRRAAITAMKAAGVPLADVLALAGHTQLATSSRYDAARLVQMPEAALPRTAGEGAGDAGAPSGAGPGLHGSPSPLDLSAVMAQLDALRALLNPAQSLSIRAIDPGSGSMGGLGGSGMAAISSESLVEPTGIEPVTYALRTDSEAPAQPQVPVSAARGVAQTSADDPRLTQSAGRIADARSALLEAAAKAVAAGNWELADQIRDLLRAAPHPSPVAPVIKLSSVRKR